MLFYLFEYLEQFDFPGAGMFHYISFRASLAIITSLIISMIFGKRIIIFLQRKQIGETIRDLGLEGQLSKKGTPTMGGIIILAAILIPVLLFGDLSNVYVLLMLLTTVWLGFVGFLDDYIKVFKKNKEGLRGKFKMLGQIVLGSIIAITMYFHNDVVIRENVLQADGTPVTQIVENELGEEQTVVLTEDVKSTKVNVPFFKNNEFDYFYLISWMGENARKYTWIVFVLAVIFIISAVSNGANLTDGLDGLAAGSSAIIGVTLGILAYVSGNTIFADYLNIMYIPNTGELVVFISAFIGAMVGFMWYNSYPAQVFMGDTGSLAIGGIVGVFAILIRKELLIPILCGVFLVETLSVALQVSWFKYTRKKTGEGKRIFLMSPLHHHFQKKGYPEAKIVTRFWIVGILLAVITIVTLKIR
ncbi:MAG: phospho-N-acetylmuramoyl-pentapeptide-transferase [Bacteroidales bacterium]|nr:phospho-N-acetylmuramoyl-pentapeptide-transferase [Bacteroidales bacterium]MBN2817971.1 phospho-N-acetylmuramoyl-pentapeptide-transferase [Bacteroidales bacterium]